jgi:3-oxoadipate enol-lactonase
MPTFACRALSLHYQLHGKGNPVLLIHGLGCSGADWALQISALETQFQVIVPDLPGCGLSPPPKSGYSIAGVASSLWALLDDLKISSTNIVGFSMGGAIALEMALQHPARVSRLALINSLASYHGNWRKWLYARMSAAVIRLFGMRNAASMFATTLFPEPRQRPIRDRAAVEIATIPARDYLGMSDALERWAATEQLNQIKGRILLIAGEHDHTPLSEKLALAAQLRANIVVIRGSRHGTPFDASVATNACLMSLLTDQPLPADDQLTCDTT